MESDDDGDGDHPFLMNRMMKATNKLLSPCK